MTLSVPEDVAVESLLPPLLDACRADGTATWTLAPRGGAPIAARRTLREAGVPPGAVLALRMTGLPERRPPPVLPLADPDGAARRRRVGAELERAIAEAAPERAGAVLVVASIARGCGKTTVASLLARALPRPPLAIDGDLASRGLTRVLAPHATVPADMYARVIGRRLRLGSLAAGAGPYGTPVLPAPAGFAGQPPDAARCAGFLREQRGGRRLVLLDCPAGFTTAWSQAAWAAGDQFVLVAEDDPRDLAALAPVVAGLREAGAASAVVANHARRRGRRARETAAAALGVPVVPLPADPSAAELLRAGTLTWDVTPAGWRVPMLELAAMLASGWER